jgi:CMP-N-acetylneuraminic acid synthetase
MLRTLGIIPARAGSKRLPRKNILPLAGRPLVEHVIRAALAARRLSRVIVSSDDPEVLAIAARIDPSLPLARPAAIAGDTAPAIDYVVHALAALEAAGEPRFEAIVILQPSSPLTLPDDIDGTLRLLEESGADSSVSVVRLDHAIHPAKLKRLEGDRLVGFQGEEGGKMAAHELPELYIRNCAVYATLRRVVDGGQIIGADCRAYVMPRERSIDINDRIDYDFAKFLLDKKTKEKRLS